MPFEVKLGSFNVSNLSATIVELTDPTTPTSIIRTDQDWEVEVKFQTSGGLSHVLVGTWHVGLFIESIGAGLEQELGFVHLPLTPGPGTINYDAKVKIAAGTISVANHQTQPYKLVATVSYVQPDGRPGAMAGYLEEPIVQFYNVAP